jgi:hypothetical protein
VVGILLGLLGVVLQGVEALVYISQLFVLKLAFH